MSKTTRSAGRYAAWVEQNLKVVSRSGEEWMCTCVFHDDDKGKMQVNVDKGLFTCFVGHCGQGGSIKKIALELGLRDFRPVPPDLADIRRKLKRLNEGKAKEVHFKETLLDRYTFPTTYWKDRGFKKKTIETFDLGYDMVGDFVTIPLRNMHGQLLGVTRRSLDPDPDIPTRYKYPKTFKKSEHLFGDWLVNQSSNDQVVIVEGAVDAMKVWQAGFQGLAIYGSSLSTAQIRVLRRLGVGRVILFTDNDESGEKAAQRCLGNLLHKRGWRNVVDYEESLDLRREFIIHRVKYRKGMPDDPGAMNSDQIANAIDRAKRIP